MSKSQIEDDDETFLTEGYPHLGATSTIIANYCYCITNIYLLVNHYELKILYGVYHQALQRGSGVVGSDQILRILRMKNNYFTSHLFKLIHYLNIGRLVEDACFSWDEFFQICTLFGLLDLTPLIRLFIAYIGVFDDQSIDFETVLQLLQIIHQSTGFSKLSYNEDFNKYKSPLVDFISLKDLLSMIHDKCLYSQLNEYCLAVRSIIFGERKYQQIKYRMTNINHIQTYQRSHNGDLPPLSCCLNCCLVMKFYQHPYQYDYYGGKASDVDLIIKTILNLNANRRSSAAYHKNSNNPHILKIIRQGSSHSVMRPSRNKSHLHYNNNNTNLIPSCHDMDYSVSSTGNGTLHSPKRMLSNNNNNNKIYPMEYITNDNRGSSGNGNGYNNGCNGDGGSDGIPMNFASPLSPSGELQSYTFNKVEDNYITIPSYNNNNNGNKSPITPENGYSYT